ncbi:MAG: hypothetical protein ACO1TE_29235 [Prosthecobacter sp.]
MTTTHRTPPQAAQARTQPTDISNLLGHVERACISATSIAMIVRLIDDPARREGSQHPQLHRAAADLRAAVEAFEQAFSESGLA